MKPSNPLVLRDFPFSDTFFPVPCGSPFVLKIATVLAVSELPYVLKQADPRNQPKGKLPVLVDGDKVIPDSNFILDYLRETYKVDLNSHLNDVQKATAYASMMLLEEHYYFLMLGFVFDDPKNKSRFLGIYFDSLPMGVCYVVKHMVGKNVDKQLYLQGAGRHSPEDKAHLGLRALSTLATLLGDSTYFFNSPTPTNLDCTVFGFLGIVMADTGFDYPVRRELFKNAEFKNLRRHTLHMKEKYFPNSHPARELQESVAADSN